MDRVEKEKTDRAGRPPRVEDSFPVIWNLSSDSASIVPAPSHCFALSSSAKTTEDFKLLEGERLGWWEESTLVDRRDLQALFSGKIMNQEAMMLADTGADLTIVHARFVDAHRLAVDPTTARRINGLGTNSLPTLGTVAVKITIGYGIVYRVELNVVDIGAVGFDLILGMDFLARAGITIDTSRREMRLPDGEWVGLLQQPQRYGRAGVAYVKVPTSRRLFPGEQAVVPAPKAEDGDPKDYWVARDKKWIATAILKDGKASSYRVTNVSSSVVSLPQHLVVGAVTVKGERPIEMAMIRVTARRYQEWERDVYESTWSKAHQKRMDAESAEPGDMEPLTIKTEYPSPGGLLTSQGTLWMGSKSPDDVLNIFAASVAPTNLDQTKLDEEVVLREGVDLSSEEMQQQLAFIPDLNPELTPVTLESLDVGEPGLSTEDRQKMMTVLAKYQSFFIASGNGLPPAARGAVCDIDVKGAKPIAQRARKVRPEHVPQLFDLLKGLLNYGLIQPSMSPWASPIVIVLKKGGRNIRLCVDYREINDLQDLMLSPMPTLDYMVANFHAVRWLLSLDNSSGFWVVRATARARKVSAFICALGHFEWTRMAQGLKNAPMIYQRMITNALYGFVDLPPGVDDLDEHGEPRDMFTINHSYPSHLMPPIANRLSFVDDFNDGAETWDGVVELTDRILGRLTYFNISISAAKSKFGKYEVEFLGHWISKDGLRAKPKGLASLVKLEFPTSLTGMQSFLGSLNFYSRFIENYAIKASSLYELSHEELRAGRVSEAAKTAFTSLKEEYANLPTLRHADPTKGFHLLLYTTNWAISATLCQEHDGHLLPLRFCGRVLKGGEPRYEPWAKEVLALLRALKVCYFELRSRQVTVYTRSDVVRWLMKDKTNKADRLPWAAVLSPWTLKIVTVAEVDERWNLSAMLADCLRPPDQTTMTELMLYEPNKSKTGLKPRDAQLPSLQDISSGYVASFDGAVKIKERIGSYGAIIWKLPEWNVVWAGIGAVSDGTVNTAEYHGAIAVLTKAVELGLADLHVFGDSRLVIHQALEWMQCHQEHLRGCLQTLRSWESKLCGVQFHHVLRYWNGSSDYLATVALRHRVELLEGKAVDLTAENYRQVQSRNGLRKLLGPSQGDAESRQFSDVQENLKSTGNNVWVTQFAPPSGSTSMAPPSTLRLRKICAAQDREVKLAILKKYLKGKVEALTSEECNRARKMAPLYELGEEDALYRLNWNKQRSPDPRLTWAIVIPQALVPIALSHCHDDLQGGHFKMFRTYERLKMHFYWDTMYIDAKKYVEACEQCATGGSKPSFQTKSPGNLVPRRPMDLVNFDLATELPKTVRGNTQLAVYVDNFTGLVMSKAIPNRTALTLAETYMDTVFYRFGASREIRHDRDPAFMGEVFRHFMGLLGQKQLPTFAYRPQANGTAERTIQTLIRAVKLYVADPHQRDWDVWAERLTFALNTVPSATRKETPFFLMHGFDPHTTMTAGLPQTQDGHVEAWKWRSQLFSDFRYCLSTAGDVLKQAVEHRAVAHNAAVPEDDLRIKVGDSVWLYIDKVKPGVKRKLAHLWHGAFRVVEKKEYYSVLEINRDQHKRPYRFHTEVHDSRLKLKRVFLLRPVELLPDQPPVVFDEDWLPEDSFEPAPGQVGVIHGVRDQRHVEGVKEFEVQLTEGGPWTWIAAIALPPLEIVFEFERQRLRLDRLEMMVQAELTVPENTSTANEERSD